MKDFNYHKAAELDGRLEQVIESHRESTKESSTPEPESGLQAFVGRQTIAEEIAGITPTKVANLREELARERIEEIIDARSSKLDSFCDTVKMAAEHESRRKTAEATVFALATTKVAEDGSLAWHEKHRPAIGAGLGAMVGTAPGAALLARGHGVLGAGLAGLGAATGGLVGEHLGYRSLRPEAQMAHIQSILGEKDLDPEDRPVYEEMLAEAQARKAKPARA